MFFAIEFFKSNNGKGHKIIFLNFVDNIERGIELRVLEHKEYSLSEGTGLVRGSRALNISCSHYRTWRYAQ